MFFAALISAFAASLSFGIGLIVTQRFHGHLSLDCNPGVQKLHITPTPRVGGIALACGAFAGGSFLPDDAQSLWWLICLAALPAFAFGLLEDLTKSVRVKTRLLATIFSGLIFCSLSGYRITVVDIAGIDILLSFWLPSLLFTAFAIGGIANAINIIDGVNGLASGSAIIVLSGFAIVAWQVEDHALVGACLVGIGTLFGFFLLNFPSGKLFLGDAGAYSAGLLLAVIAVALPQRNAEISPLVGLLALAYPVTETLVSIHRRALRKGSHPGSPDRVHLHSLIYRSRARQIATALDLPHLRNPLAGLLLLGMTLISVTLMVFASRSSALVWVGFGLFWIIYLTIYRKVALLGPFFKGLRGSPNPHREIA